MNNKNISIYSQQIKPIKVIKWKVQLGITVAVGRVLLLYDFADSQISQNKKLKSTAAGIIRRIFAKEGDVINKGY